MTYRKEKPSTLCKKLGKAFGGKGTLVSAKRSYYRRRSDEPYSKKRVVCRIKGAKVKPELYLKDGKNLELDAVMEDANFSSYDVWLTLKDFLIEFDIATRVKHKGKWGAMY